MGTVMKKLPDNIFMQIHRSSIVNIFCVDKFVGNCIYCGETLLLLSKQYKSEILSLFIVLEKDE